MQLTLAQNTNNIDAMNSSIVPSYDDVVLIVDDDSINRIMLSRYLKVLGYKTQMAVDGQQALELLHSQTFGAVLLDIEMPNMDGYEVLQHLKADATLSRLPVIMISALDKMENVVKCIQLGAEDYLPKPFNPVLLQARLNSCLEKKHLREQQEDLLHREVERLSKLTKLKDQFVNTVTHDLRNPVSLIISYSELLQTLLSDSISNNPQVEKYLSKIRNNAQKTLKLVTDLLDLAHFENGVALDLTITQLQPFLRLQLDEFDLVAQQRRITLNLEMPEETVLVLLDTLQMARAINNLLSNALKYTPSGGKVQLVARLIEKNEQNQVIIEVSDNGTGIPAEALPFLFDKFYRVNLPEHWAVEGTGLGLAIVKAVIEQHGSAIKVETELGKGTCFSLTLPLQN